MQVTWQGQKYDAASGQWVVQLAIPTADVEAVGSEASLRRGQGQLIVDQFHNPLDQLLGSMSVSKYLGQDLYLVQADPKADPATVITDLSRLPDVKSVSPDFILHVDTIPNDPQFGQQYSLQNTGQFGGTPRR